MYQIKCNNCGKKMTIPSLNLGYTEYFAESHMMETGHTADIVEV